MSAAIDTSTGIVQRAIEMRAAGHTLAEIGAALGVHFSTVQKWTTPPGTARPYSRSDRRVVLHLARASKRSLVQAAYEVPLDEHPHAGHGRPATYGECLARGLGAETPCPYVSCRGHLALDVSANGNIALAWPDGDGGVDLDAMPHTCSLRAADLGGMTLDAAGEAVGVTRERSRQIEALALATLGETLRAAGVRGVDDVIPGVAWCSAHEVIP